MISFFIFFPLCLIVNGQTDCSFEWTVIDDRQTFEDTYDLYKTTNKEASTVGAFLSDGERRIFYYEADTRTIVHEVKHALCILNNVSYENRLNCHWKVDMIDISLKSTR